ncbi:unnamed protein product [Adineta ricciae]|uniref:Uncharacterized protein n=1 Tax=Adineta ricciae TaxID=249248 RepID=A0A815CJQ5_ADIRI|nr:unnamed protein product [Adineta ricciae]
MNQLETNLVLWAICSILVFEILIIICLCRFCFNRIKPKRFYVKREEFEYLQGVNGASSQFQPIILRPPQADELALVGTIRDLNPPLKFDSGIQNLGFYRDPTDDDILAQVPPPSSSSQRLNWIELRSAAAPSQTPPALSTTSILKTAQLPAADYEIRSYPIDEYLYTHQSPPPRPTVIDFQLYRDDYSNDGYFDDNENNNNDDDVLENVPVHSFRHPEMFFSHTQRTDTSTESHPGNYSALLPRSILKGNMNEPLSLDLLSTNYFQPERSRSSSKFDESPLTSVKVNTDEAIPIDYPISAIEKITPNESFSSTPARMRFASVSQLNEIEWEIPREFQTIVYDLTDDHQPLRGALIYSSNDNLNNNNNNNNNSSIREHLSTRQRSQSANIDQRSHVSRIFVPWDQRRETTRSFYLSSHPEHGDTTQQQAFEY